MDDRMLDRVVGTIVSVGGAYPEIVIRVGHSSHVTLRCTEDTARQAGSLLYRRVLVTMGMTDPDGSFAASDLAGRVEEIRP